MELNGKEKLGASLLLLVIALSSATIGYSCASYKAFRDDGQKLFMCPCGRVYILDMDHGNLSIIQVTPPGQQQQEDGERWNGIDQWL